jgi:DNA repair protein REV1
VAPRREIYDQTGCPASAGICTYLPGLTLHSQRTNRVLVTAHNLLLARLATNKAKPAGQFYLKEEQVEEFMKGVNVDQLPGVGPSLSERLRQRDIHTVADLQLFSQVGLPTSDCDVALRESALTFSH